MRLIIKLAGWRRRRSAQRSFPQWTLKTICPTDRATDRRTDRPTVRLDVQSVSRRAASRASSEPPETIFVCDPEADRQHNHLTLGAIYRCAVGDALRCFGCAAPRRGVWQTLERIVERRSTEGHELEEIEHVSGTLLMPRPPKRVDALYRCPAPRIMREMNRSRSTESKVFG